MPEPIDLVLAGSGTLAPCHIGAYSFLVEAGFAIERVAGTSGGAIVAAGIAHGMSVEEMLSISAEVLSESILDPVPWWKPWRMLSIYGVHYFDKAHAVFRRRIPGRMGDALLEWGVFAVDLETRRPQFIHSGREHFVFSADAVISSASIPVFARARKIRGMRGLWVDGGAAVNFGMAAWDDKPKRRTVGVRFAGREGGRRPVSNVIDFGFALGQTLVNNANRTHISRKHAQDVIQIQTDASGMNFSQTKLDVLAMYEDGRRAAKRWLDSDPSAEG